MVLKISIKDIFVSIIISEEARNAVKNFELPKELGFGRVLSPIMAVCDYKDGKWGQLEVVPYGPISIDPICQVLHYAQEIFEGMKAYKVDNNGPFLFRPDENLKRFNRSAKRMAMAEVPEDIFMDAVLSITKLSSHIIPQNSGESLYLRPFMFATDNGLGVKPSNSYKFMVVASPSGSYFSAGDVSVLIEREQIRACRGGIGAAKTGGNYASSLLSARKVADLGYTQTMWLDALNHENIEELSGMNFFAVINGKLVTPKITDTILDGITRRSIISLAKSFDIQVIDETLTITKLIEAIKSGECSECFASGTAAIITPITYLVEESGEKYTFKNNDSLIANKLRETLLSIQQGKIEGPKGWSILVD